MSESQRHDITKYPNRRFYDGTTSSHVTLTDLYEIVRRGGEIVVTDKETSRDITNVVLTQIILEHDPPKMELFPSSLLHQAIQANESVMRGFIDQYFAQALDAFNQSRSQFDQFLSRSGFAGSNPFDWARMMMPGMGGAPTQSRANDSAQPSNEPSSDQASGYAQGPASAGQSEGAVNRSDDLDAVRQQLADMQAELARLQTDRNDSASAKKKVAKKKSKAKKRAGKKASKKRSSKR